MLCCPGSPAPCCVPLSVSAIFAPSIEFDSGFSARLVVPLFACGVRGEPLRLALAMVGVSMRCHSVCSSGLSSGALKCSPHSLVGCNSGRTWIISSLLSAHVSGGKRRHSTKPSSLGSVANRHVAQVRCSGSCLFKLISNH